MSSRFHKHNRHQGHRAGGLPSFFEGRLSLLGRSRRGPPTTNPPNVPSLDEEVHSDNEIFREIEDYAIEAEREDRVQARDPPLYMLTLDASWSEGESSSRGVRPSTSGAPPINSNSQYIYKDWISSFSNKKLTLCPFSFLQTSTAS